MSISSYFGKGKINDTAISVAAYVTAPIAGDDNYFCIVKIEPLFPDGKKIYGATAKNAIECANGFLKQMLDHIEFQETIDR